MTIENKAATLPSETLKQRIERFRHTLRIANEEICAQHIAEMPRRRRGLGAGILATRVHLIDGLIIEAFTDYAPLLPKNVAIALVAVGGYGREELNPASDIDLLLLLDHATYTAIRPFAETFLRFLWDIGLTVGHSVRSIRDCLSDARTDVTIMTNLMEARLLAGDEGLLANLVHRLASPKLWPSALYYEAKCKEQRARHHRYDDTGYNLEPNVKEGPGGLRDVHMIGWITRRHFGSPNLHELVKVGFLHEREYKTLIDGRNFLWQVRNGLHFLAKRREDRLLFDYQRTLAHQMGYVDRPGRLAVEQFMKRYYRTIKQLRLLNEIILQHFSEALLTPRRPIFSPLNTYFQARNNFLEAIDPQVFTRHPASLLEIFVLLQKYPSLKGVRAATIRLLRANLFRIDSQFRRNSEVQALFMTILRSPHGVTQALQRMNAYGVLGAYIPAFGKIVGQMQHDLFHVYTVDEHTLFVVRNVRRLFQVEYRDEFPEASQIAQTLQKPERLYLAALFHDIAKGRGGDHSKLGESEATAFCQRHGLSEYDATFVAWLVRHHLVMSWTAQHQDISDGEVVNRFGEQVGDREHLDNLYLLTIADIRGTNPNVWNTWKGRLLSQLYSDTTRALRRGFGTPINLKARVDEIKQEALVLTNQCATKADIEQHWARLSDDYFVRHDADSLAWHACAIVRTRDAELPLVCSRLQSNGTAIEFLIFTPIDDDLFTILTGSFERLNLSIIDARIHMAAGYALNSFVVLTGDGQARSALTLKDIEITLRSDLLMPLKPAPVRTLSRVLKHFPIATEINFSKTPNGHVTVMEVIAQDRPGLLHQVALALATCGARIVTAKVATFGERAEDVFFLTDRHGNPFVDNLSTELSSLAKEVKQRIDNA